MTSEFANYPSLIDRPILVTGGGSGIGASMVRRLAEIGAKVGFIDINETESTALIETLAKEPVKHKPVFQLADVTSHDQLLTAIDALTKATGPFLGLVNNAANDMRHDIESVTPDFWQKSFAVNLDHQFFIAQHLLPDMKATGGGSIVNMGSMSWHVGVENLSSYMAAKAAVEGLTNGMARDLGPERIRVNCVVPGMIRTQRQIDLWLTEDAEKEVFNSQCLREFIDPVYVANMVAFLLSDDARMCTSGTYPVHAGWI